MAEKISGYRPDMAAILAQVTANEAMRSKLAAKGLASSLVELPYTPKVLDTRATGSGSLQLLYGRGGPGSKLGEGDYALLQAFYKFELDMSYGYNRAKAGELFWAIEAIEIKEGPAELRPAVFDLEGKSLTYQNILAFCSWCGADNEFPSKDVIDPKYAARPCGIYGYGFVGQTETKGGVGFGTSGGSYIGPEGGPFTVWLSSDRDPAGARVGSDALHRVGWFDNHIHPNPMFRVTRKGSAPVPTGDYSLAIEVDGKVVGRLAFETEPVTGELMLSLWKGDERIGAVVVPEASQNG